MNSIDIKDLKYDTNNYFQGTFGRIYELEVPAGMCFKSFKGTLKHYGTVSNFFEKLNYLTQFKDSDEIIIPQTIVTNNYETVGYLTKYKSHYLDIAAIECLPANEKVVVLKKCKEAIETMYRDYKIIHGDIHSSNILYNYHQDKVCIIDFDSCQVGNYKLEKYVNNYAKMFLKYNNPCHELDVYLFNLLTFIIMNNLKDYNKALVHIISDDTGVFESKESKILIKRLFFTNNKPDKDYLIDTL